MKKSKLLLLWTLTFVAGLVVGGACMRAYQTPQGPACAAFSSDPKVDLLLAKLEEMGTPEGVSEVAQDYTPKSSAELPSQLVRSELPDDVVLGLPSASAKTEEGKPNGVVLSDEQKSVVLNARQPAQRAADGSNLTLIEAPVGVKRIKTLDEYKAFKTQARGSYPTADFAKEEVVVLESVSNLPDKVFEIVDIAPEGGNLKVRYRVNVFGLDKKINTHSAQKIDKSSLPIILEQVL